MTTRAFLQISLVVSLAALSCQNSNTVAGPNAPAPTPTPPPVAMAGDWVGIYQGDPALCQTFNLAAATASLVENGSALTGNLTSTEGHCPTAVRLQAIRNGTSFSGTATQLGYTGTVTGRLDHSDLIIELSAMSNGTSSLPGGSAQLHRP